MCGIWALILKDSNQQIKSSYDAFTSVAPRGPDNSYFTEHNKPYNIKIGFHRLSIMDPSLKGDQPFIFEYIDTNGRDKTVIVICNGEIYNFRDLITEYNIELKSGSDCEIIGHLYILFGVEKLMNLIRGEFAFVIFDMDKINGNITLCVSRDPFGIRPLYMYMDTEYINFSSELKGILPVYNKIEYEPTKLVPFKGGQYMIIERIDNIFVEPQYFKYYEYPDINSINRTNTDLVYIKQSIVNSLTEAVRIRLMSDKPVGCLLSGGLDSSLISSIASELLKKEGKRLKTFSIGMDGSTDEKYAKMVAEYIDSDHTHIKLDQSVWIDALPDIIYAIETYDTTTVRASTGQFLAGKKIAEISDVKVLLIGDGSDELCSGYLYFHNAPSGIEAHQENIRLLDDISFFDVKRADEGISRNGLEARVPFLDVNFVNTYLSIDPELRIPQYYSGTNIDTKIKLEKWLLRESFRDTKLLPNSVLYRKKEAFSDGVSSTEKSWYTIISEHVNTLYTDEYLLDKQKMYTHNVPVTKEMLYYRECFESFFGKNADHIIPYYWLPKWCGDVNEPSARVLDVYNPIVKSNDKINIGCKSPICTVA
jgi:asparagine synthase (glutamine-hydrolysing)